MKESRKEVPKTPGKTPKEQSVPFGFETVPALDEESQCPCLENTKHKELWLIKVPTEFDPSSLTGKTVVMNGIQDVSMNGAMGGETRFEIISKSISDSVSDSCKALLPSSQDASIWEAKTFVGNMSVVQSVSVPTQHSLSSPEPSRHRVQPSDITCRWKPFGYKKPFAAKNTTTNREESESTDDQKPAFGLKRKDRTSKREQKQAGRSREKKKHTNKTTKNRQERDEKVDEAEWKSKKIKTEKSSPQKEPQIKAEKISSTAKGKKRIDKAAESNCSFIPLGGKVKTDIITEQEGEEPKKKRKKEKRKQH